MTPLKTWCALSCTTMGRASVLRVLFVTKDLKPCRAIARLIAIVANWWIIFCRLADGDRHLEPTTSRTMYMGVESDLGTNHGSELDCATKQSLRFGGR